jgi:acyl dehydratase
VQDKVTTAGLLHHEDLAIGAPYELGRKTVSKDEIIAYGRAYDPQPLHTDEEGAKATLVGGLCASGWHTCAIMMRLVADGILNRVASLGSPGVDEARWIVPVRPGDTLGARYLVQEKRDLASRPDVGVSKVLVEAFNQKGETVANWVTNQLTRRRRPGPAATATAPRRERRQMPDLWDGPVLPKGMRRHDLYFEDREIGETLELGSHTFGRDEIIGFAREFDPQPFHLDEAAAKASLFGALCASGWHTAAYSIRGAALVRLEGNAEARARGARLPAYGPSPGCRDIRWPKPVYVGDTVSYRGRLIEKIDLKSRPDRGILATQIQARNQKGEVVFGVITQILAERREPYRPA